jgi:hypothetical protein
MFGEGSNTVCRAARHTSACIRVLPLGAQTALQDEECMRSCNLDPRE